MGDSTTITAAELREMSEHARVLEGIITDIATILSAIAQGEMLSALPADEENRARHNTATSLLDIAIRTAEKVDQLQGTELSIRLFCAAQRSAQSNVMAIAPRAGAGSKAAA